MRSERQRRMRGHVAFISFPHPAEVNPTIPIVSVLARRGYRVSYVTSERFARRIADAGGEVVRCPAFNPSEMFQAADHDEVDAREPVCRLAAGTLAAVTAVFENDRPDLIIYDALALAGRIIAARSKIPAVQTTPIFALDRQHIEAQIPDANFRNEELGFYRAVDRFLQKHGIASDDFGFFKEKLNVHLFPRALQPPGDVFGPRFFYAGRCPAEQPYYGEWTNPRPDLPCVLVSNSTTYSRGPEFFRMCIEAFSGLGLHVILSVGDHIGPADLGPLPERFEIVQGVANVKVLPHTCLLVCPGGIVSQAEAAYHGVPVIAISHGFGELEWVGENVPRLGVGLHLKKSQTTAEQLRAAAVQVCGDRALQERVRSLQRGVQREAGGEETANRILDYLETGA